MFRLHTGIRGGVARVRPDTRKCERGVVNDSRIGHARALIDDARTILTELGDEIVGNNQLEAARFSLNVSIKHLNILEAS